MSFDGESFGRAGTGLYIQVAMSIVLNAPVCLSQTRFHQPSSYESMQVHAILASSALSPLRLSRGMNAI